MPLPKLELPPESARFSSQMGEAVLRAVTAGELSRTRLDQLGAPMNVSVGWTASVAEFAYLGAFYRSAINHGSAPFLIDLLANSSVPVECEARFLPGGFALTGVSGYAHLCTAQLEVVTPARNAVADAALVAARAAAIGGLPVMALTPSASGYSVQRGDTLLQARPGMGPGIVRLDRYNTPSVMSVSWNVGPADFDYLMAFYFTAVAEGALPFLIEAVLDHPDPRQLRAKILPGSMMLRGLNGLTYSVTCNVEVVPILSSDYDASVLALFEEMGEEWPDVLDLLERLVNVVMPTWD